MQKTKLGITIGMLSALVYFVALVGGYTPLFLLVGYILLFEEPNDWLRRVCYKAIALTVMFSGAVIVVNLIPEAFGCISNFLGIFEGYLSYGVISSIVIFVTSVIDIVETVLFLLLTVKAIKIQDVKMKKIDEFVDSL